MCDILSAQLSLPQAWHGDCLMNTSFTRTTELQSIHLFCSRIFFPHIFRLVSIYEMTHFVSNISLFSMNTQYYVVKCVTFLNCFWWFVYSSRVNVWWLHLHIRNDNWMRRMCLWIVDSGRQMCTRNKHTRLKYTCETNSTNGSICWLLVWFQ